MMDHIMSANEMYDKYKFAEKYSVQFVLAGLQIDSDNSCQAQALLQRIQLEWKFFTWMYISRRL